MGKPSETSAREEAVDYVLAADEDGHGQGIVVGPTGSDKGKTKNSDKTGVERAPFDPSRTRRNEPILSTTSNHLLGTRKLPT